MKKLIIVCTVFVCGCAAFGNMDNNAAKKVAETLIQKESSGDYAGMSQYYTDDFNSGESVEARTAKFKDLHDTFGDMTGMEMVSLKDSTDPNELHCVYLIYKVRHTKVNSIEEFIVISDEGKYRAEIHTINTEK